MSMTPEEEIKHRDELFDKVQELHEENRILRSALEEQMDYWRPEHDAAIEKWRGSGTECFQDETWMSASVMSEIISIAREALTSTPLSAQYQKRQEAMKAVVEAARRLTPHNLNIIPEIMEALAALDSLSEREKEGL